MLRNRSFIRCAARLRAFVDTALESASTHFKNGEIQQCITSNLDIFENKIPVVVLNDGNMWLKVASARINTAFAYKLLAEFDKALIQVEEGIKLMNAHFTKCKPELCHALDLSAELLIAAGRHNDAQQYVTRSLDLKKNIYPAGSPHFINSLNLQGAIHFSATDLSKAESSFTESMKIGISNFGVDAPIHQQLAVTLSNLAGVWRAQEGRWRECVEAYQAVTESFGAHFGEASWMTAQASVDLGLSMIHGGAPKASKEHLVKGLGILMSTSGPSHPSVIAAMDALQNIRDVEGHDAFLEDTFLKSFFESLQVKEVTKIGSDFHILDSRGHVGGGHPFSQLK
jgi:tetratricopeptide (TPR) repeat protein